MNVYMTEFVVKNSIATKEEFEFDPFRSLEIAERVKFYTQKHPETYAGLMPHLVEYLKKPPRLFTNGMIYYVIYDIVIRGLKHDPSLIKVLRNLIGFKTRTYLLEVMYQKNAEEIKHFFGTLSDDDFVCSDTMDLLGEVLADTSEYGEFKAVIHQELKKRFTIPHMRQYALISVLYAATSEFEVIRKISKVVNKASYICKEGRMRLIELSDHIEVKQSDAGHLVWLLGDCEDKELINDVKPYLKHIINDVFASPHYEITNLFDLYTKLYGLGSVKEYLELSMKKSAEHAIQSAFAGVFRLYEKLNRHIGKYLKELIENDSFSVDARYALIAQIREDYSQKNIARYLNEAISEFVNKNK